MENHANVYLMRSRNGWRDDEEATLFTEVERARSEGKPLKAVFDIVAQKTGRKPNSIRNYYYARIKDDDTIGQCGHCTAFVPFTNEEVRELVKTVLSAQARGISVRACTLAMGNGDNKAMLRYQNKYRSVIKTNKKLVEEIMDQMSSEGLPVFDPYSAIGRKKAGRPRKSSDSLVDVVSSVVNELSAIDGLDVNAFFVSLGILALNAQRGLEATRRLQAIDNSDGLRLAQLAEQNTQLKDQIAKQSAELSKQKERFAKLMSMFKQLLQVNSEFLGLNSMVKMSSLSSYIRELSRYVEDYEQAMQLSLKGEGL